MAFPRDRPRHVAGSEPRLEPVDQPRQRQRALRLAGKVVLGGGHRFDPRGGQLDQVKAESGVDPFQTLAEQKGDMGRVAGGGGGPGVDPAQRAIDPPDRQPQPPRALVGGGKIAAQRVAQARQVLGRVQHRFGQAGLDAKDGRRFGRVQRLGQAAHRLVQPDQRVVGGRHPAEPAGQRQPRDRGQVGHRPQPQPPQQQPRVGRQPQGGDRQGGQSLGRAGDGPHPAEPRQPPGGAPGRRHGQRGAKSADGQRAFDGGQHRGLAAPQVVGACGVHHQSRPAAQRGVGTAAIGGGPGAEPARPQRQPVQRGGIALGIGRFGAQAGAEGAGVGQPCAQPHPRRGGGAVGCVDDRAVPALDPQGQRQVSGRRAARPRGLAQPAFHRKGGERNRDDPARGRPSFHPGLRRWLPRPL